MKDKTDLLNRYISKMTKYLSYENSLIATEDLNNMINLEFPNGYNFEELEKFLLSIGSPYNFSLHYETKVNMLISGKNYEIFLKFIKIMMLDILLAVIIYGLSIGFSSYSKLEVINMIKVLIITAFITGILSSYISEKVKDTRIMSSLIKDFTISELYNTPKQHINNPVEYIFIFVFSLFIFLALQYSELNNILSLSKALQIIYFMIILRDINRISEIYYGKFIKTLSVITDTGSLILLVTILKKYFINSNVSLVFYLLILTIGFDLLSTVFNITKIGGRKNKKRRN